MDESAHSPVMEDRRTDMEGPVQTSLSSRMYHALRIVLEVSPWLRTVQPSYR